MVNVDSEMLYTQYPTHPTTVPNPTEVSVDGAWGRARETRGRI